MPKNPQVRNSAGVDYTVSSGNTTTTGIVVRNSSIVDYKVTRGHVRNNVSVDTLFYERSKTIIPGITMSKRGNDLDEISAGPSSIAIICRETSGNGNTAALYTYADVGPYKTLCMDIVCHFASLYGQCLVGIGNLDSFQLDYWPTITNGWAWEQGIKPGHFGIIEGAQTKSVPFRLDVSSLSGNKCIGLCCVSRSSISATTHVSCNKIWLE